MSVNLKLASSFKLNSTLTIKNRIVKSALSEALADLDGTPSHDLINLYRTWSRSGAGVLVTGNVVIDSKAIGEPGNVVIEDERNFDLIAEWADTAKSGGSEIWMQINHPGKQAIRGLNKETVAPSAIPFSPKMAAIFATPRELTHIEIEELIQRYATTAEIAKKAGFTGVQLHGAHGYLISQFLSPLHNRRTDQWGGTAEKRRRFVLEVYNEVRTRVGDEFPISIKLNSADFQRGGFSEEESLATIQALDDMGINLIEISGGSFEKPVSQLGITKQSTIAREAYFLEFAKKVREISKVPLMVTGGFRSIEGMENALLNDELDFIGLGRIFAIEPSAPQRLLKGLETYNEVKPLTTGFRFLDSFGSLELTWYTRQLHRIARGESPIPNENGLKSFILDFKDKGLSVYKKRRLRAL
ncbi:NADH:flavin oxidoreductase/NADH oxidase family protein [Acinetobacter sp. ESBL14]|uniref:NADH:flavin oxidoreductase/NADH oxidase family protein n=1 Tax=Acinetobacter sp. ESBL14 TaxID=3077329 RepID=UPI002FCBDFA3